MIKPEVTSLGWVVTWQRGTAWFPSAQEARDFRDMVPGRSKMQRIK